MTIPQMNKKINELDQFFTSRTQSFTHQISLHQGKFTPEDKDEFEALLNEIKEDAINKIQEFFNNKFSIRSTTYETQIKSFSSDGDNVQNQLETFRQNLVRETLEMKEEQNRKQNLMEHFSQKLRKNVVMKKCLKILKDYQTSRQKARELDAKMDRLYQKNLMKKTLFPWRTLTYKDGYGNSVRRQAEKDMSNIHEQYQGIIQILKNKINETDEIIRVKKASKGQFAYALSKNLLKTISSLSLQVMNLNQMSLRDGQWAEQSTQKFMGEVDTIIKQKILKVRQYRKGLLGQGQTSDEIVEKKKKHISFA